MIIVDPIVEYTLGVIKPEAREHGRVWCHLVSDTSFEELHEFAQRLGLRREWFQGDHYDLIPSKRAQAVALGAVEMSIQDMVRVRVKNMRCSSCGHVEVRRWRGSVCSVCTGARSTEGTP